MQPLVSVVIPVYNSEATIEDTLDSVIKQTYKNIEIILVDDGSKDRSNEIMQNYIKNHPNNQIKLITKENGGVSSSRNKGIDESTGDFISFLDSDDQWDYNKIETQIDVFYNHSYVDCLGTNMNGEKFKRLFGFKFERLTQVTPRMMLMKNFLCIQTVLVKRNVIQDIGYFYEDQDNEDSNIIIRIAQKYNCYLLNESYVKYIPNISGVSSRMWEMEKGELKNVQMAVKMKMISPFEYPFFTGFSLLKFFRRWIVSFMFRIWKK